MTLRRFDPLRDLLVLQERMNRLFEDSLTRTTLDDAPQASGTWAPAADLYETAEGFVLLLDLPGVHEDDVEIHVDGDELTVKGQRRLASATRPESFHRMERSYGPFSRSFKLTEDVDPDKVTAQFRDGLLRLEMPKVRSRAAWRVRVEESD